MLSIFQPIEPVIILLQKRIDFFLRARGKTVVLATRFEVGHEGLGTVGQPFAVLIEVRVKTISPLGFKILLIGKNGGCRADGRGGRKQFMHRSREFRVVRQPVRQCFDRTLQCGDAPMTGRQSFGPRGKAPGQFVRTLDFGGRQIGSRCGFAQGRYQRGFRAFGEHRWLDAQCLSDVQKKFATDSAPVMLY